jgi:hypothetical protein
MKNYFFIILLCSFVLESCNKSEEVVIKDPKSALQKYFPLRIGKATIFKADSILVKARAGIGVFLDTTTTYQKEEIIDSLSPQGLPTQWVIQFSDSKNPNGPWEIKSQKVVTQNNEGILSSEGNLTFWKLSLPIYQGQSWDGNRYFDQYVRVKVASESLEMYKGWSYSYTSTDLSYSTPNGSAKFGDVIEIKQVDTENALERRYSVEKYAPGVGLVYQSQIIFDTQCIEDCIGKTWPEKAEKGFILERKAIGFY